MYTLQKNSQHLIRKAVTHNLRRLHLSRPTFAKASRGGASTKKKYTPDEKRVFWEGKKCEENLSESKKVQAYISPGDAHLTVKLRDQEFPYNIAWLRDACPGHCCIDKSTTQKTFQTTDIPENIGIREIEQTPDGGIKITWKNDLPQYNETREHFSVYSREFFENHISFGTKNLADTIGYGRGGLPSWNSQSLSLQRIPYQKFMDADRDLYEALRLLVRDGIIMIKDVPASEASVESIAKRIGNLRDSLYGRTWDVKSVPEAKNVAYTSTFLGLHMDLLYMQNPPGLQLLHCLKNSCQGGTAVFSDSFNTVLNLSNEHQDALVNHKTAYHYRNNNEYYYHEHSTLEVEVLNSRRLLKYVNWSPPFQANYPFTADPGQTQHLPDLLKASRAFAKSVEASENVFRYDYEEGDCVIFNNRRVLHGREAFQAEGGERWLRGAYIDTDVFYSRLRVLREQYDNANMSSVGHWRL